MNLPKFSLMKSNFFILLTAACALTSSSCSLTQKLFELNPEKDTATVPVPEGPRIVGRIASVSGNQNFVLIQSYGKWEGESGLILTTRGSEKRTANLKTTGEKLGEFLAADIQSGSVEVGDAVYSHHEPIPVASPAVAESLQPQQIKPLENVQKNN